MISPKILQKSPQYLIQTQRYATDADDVDPDIWPLINLHPLSLHSSCLQYITPDVSSQCCRSSDVFHPKTFPRLILTHRCFLGWFPQQDVSSVDSHPWMFPWTPPDVSSADSHPQMFPWTPSDVSTITPSTGCVLSAYNVNWIPWWLQVHISDCREY